MQKEKGFFESCGLNGKKDTICQVPLLAYSVHFWRRYRKKLPMLAYFCTLLPRCQEKACYWCYLTKELEIDLDESKECQEKACYYVFLTKTSIMYMFIGKND